MLIQYPGHIKSLPVGMLTSALRSRRVPKLRGRGDRGGVQDEVFVRKHHMHINEIRQTTSNEAKTMAHRQCAMGGGGRDGKNDEVMEHKEPVGALQALWQLHVVL